MNTLASNRKASALTLIETLVVVAVLALAFALFLPALLPAKRRPSRLHCVSNLKQVGLAFHIWAGDNGGKYPMQVSVTNGGTMELVQSGNVFPHFAVMSNELNAPKLLVCPQDLKRTAATNFARDFTDRNISYFVGVDADSIRSEMLLAGDRNITASGVQLKHGLASLATNSLVGWSQEMHNGGGNIALADGSVHRVNAKGLHELLEKSGVATNRLAIP